MRDGATPLAVRAYRACLRLLPPGVLRADGEEMAGAFRELWRGARGMGPRARVALRCFGRLPRVAAVEWLELLRETGTQGWRREIMTGWGRDVRYALRTLRRAPAFTLTTLGLIGLGVGAVTTIFTVVDHVLLRPLPYPEADRLVTVEEGAFSGITYRGFEELGSVEAWAAGYGNDANLTGEGDPVRVRQAMVSERFFSLLGARPAAGRLPLEADFGGTEVAVVSHRTWLNVFGGAPDLVGRTLRVDGAPVLVIGVLSPDFEPPLKVVNADVDLWRPIDWSQDALQRPSFSILQVVGRLTPGATLADLQAELDGLGARLGGLYPDNMLDRDGKPFPLPAVGLQDAMVQRVRTGLHLLLGAVGVLLLVACLNIAHLFLARGLGRAQEMAVRRALGAGTAGVAKQLLVESLLLGVGGGLLGLGLAWLGLGGYLTLNPDVLPRAAEVRLDMPVLGFAGAVSMLTALLFGLTPALRTVGRDLAGELRGASRSSTASRGAHRLRSVLVAAEVALSLVLVAQAGLLVRSFLRVHANDPGFQVDGLVTVPLSPTGIDEPADYVIAMEEIRASLAAVPGVESATYGFTQPFEFTGGGRCCWSTSRMTVNGEPREDVRVLLQPVSREYFETLRLPMLLGATWSAAEEGERPVPAVFAERLAIDMFGSASAALGQVVGDPARLQLRVVGVSGDSKHYGLDQPTPTSAYVPVAAAPFTLPMAHMAVRLSEGAPRGIERSLREAVWRVAPDMPVPTVRSMEEWMDGSTAGRRFDSALFAGFGVAGLLLAAAGLYGTLLFMVRQRSRELGIRLALGAARSRVEREVVGQGVRLALLGSVVGVVVSWRVGRLLEARLYEVQAADPAALGGAVVVLIAAAGLASWLPARRAGRTDPVETLRTE